MKEIGSGKTALQVSNASQVPVIDAHWHDIKTEHEREVPEAFTYTQSAATKNGIALGLFIGSGLTFLFLINQFTAVAWGMLICLSFGFILGSTVCLWALDYRYDWLWNSLKAKFGKE